MFCSSNKLMTVEIVHKNDFKIMTSSNNLVYIYLTTGFNTIILCSVHSIQFVKYVFSAEIWSMKILTRIMKYKSRVIKLNPDD